ncbi:MAG: LamG-like jellyroll fold domain-containing protein [Acholeplasmataceae bacterium]
MNKNKSFTLIELLVVIVIIGILAGVIMISTSSSIDKASIAKSKVFEESVQNNLAVNMVSAWDADHVTKGATWVLNDKWGSNNGTFYDSTSTACTTSLCPQIVSDNQMGNVLSFDGVNDHIDIGDILDMRTDDMTICIWIKTSENVDNQYFISKAKAAAQPYRYAFGIALGKLRIFMQGDSLSPDIVVNGNIFISDSRWHFASATYDRNGNASIHVDGIYDTGLSISHWNGLDMDYDNPFRIGSYTASDNVTLSTPFDGYISSIKIYNAALTSSQIKQYYIAGLDSLLSKGSISKAAYNQRINVLAYEQ